LVPDFGGHAGGDDADQTQAVTPITIRPHDPRTGEEIDKAQVVKGYEYGRGQFVTFTPEELKALDVESSKVIDLEKLCHGVTSIPSISTPPITFTRMARWRRKPSG
jgi:hypothetical protein